MGTRVQGFKEWQLEHRESLYRRYLHEVPTEPSDDGEFEVRMESFDEYCEKEYLHSA